MAICEQHAALVESIAQVRVDLAEFRGEARGLTAEVAAFRAVLGLTLPKKDDSRPLLRLKGKELIEVLKWLAILAAILAGMGQFIPKLLGAG